VKVTKASLIIQVNDKDTCVCDLSEYNLDLLLDVIGTMSPHNRVKAIRMSGDYDWGTLEDIINNPKGEDNE
jgi:hypothetical protein